MNKDFWTEEEVEGDVFSTQFSEEAVDSGDVDAYEAGFMQGFLFS